MDSPATYGSGWTDRGKFGKALNFDRVNDYVDMGIQPQHKSPATSPFFLGLSLKQHCQSGYYREKRTLKSVGIPALGR